MAAPVIQANYDDLATIAGNFSQQAQAVQDLMQQVAQLKQALEIDGWTGVGAQAFFAEMDDLVLPAMHRLNDALNDAQAVVGQISNVFHDAEEEAGRLFQGDYPGGIFSSLFGGAMGGDSGGGSGKGVAVDISKYRNGVDGWSLISIDGTQGFTPDELVSQKGNTCALYAPINLLIASGYDISQWSADPFVDIMKMDEAWWRPDMWFDDDPNWGFGMGVSEDVIEKWAPNSNYQHDDFGPLVRLYPTKAEQFLIKTVQGGQPVMVLMEMDDSFGGSGGHFATVLGVQTYPDGKLKSVLLATNWASKPVMEIPAASFMDDWLGRNDGEYMTVERKPAPPPHILQKIPGRWNQIETE